MGEKMLKADIRKFEGKNCIYLVICSGKDKHLRAQKM